MESNASTPADAFRAGRYVQQPTGYRAFIPSPLLVTFLLCEQRVLEKPVLYLSYYFERHRQEYYDRLQAVRDKGAWEEWIEFFLRGIVEVSGQATETARRILRLREDHRTTITERLGRAAGNGHRVLEHLYLHPIVSVNEVQELIGMTYQAANDLVARFEACGILKEITGQARNRKFQYASYIQLFHESPPDDNAGSSSTDPAPAS